MFDFKGKNVYLSGRITGRDRAEVEQEFKNAAEYVVCLGANYVFNPTAEIVPTCGHELAMRFCLRQLCRSKVLVNGQADPYFDVILMLPKWEYSPGACLEASVARAVGIEIVKFTLPEVD